MTLQPAQGGQRFAPGRATTPVSAEIEAGKLYVAESAAYSSVDSVDIIVPGIGAHGASPHRGKDPVLIGAQIVVAFQQLVSRELSPREPGVVTVGVFRAGNKRNVIGEEAVLELTVRSDTQETRQKLLEGIERRDFRTIDSTGLRASVDPSVVTMKGGVPVTVNDMRARSRTSARPRDFRTSGFPAS